MYDIEGLPKYRRLLIVWAIFLRRGEYDASVRLLLTYCGLESILRKFSEKLVSWLAFNRSCNATIIGC